MRLNPNTWEVEAGRGYKVNSRPGWAACAANSENETTKEYYLKALEDEKAQLVRTYSI